MCLGIILPTQDGRFIDIKTVSYDYLIIYALTKVRAEKKGHKPPVGRLGPPEVG